MAGGEKKLKYKLQDLINEFPRTLELNEICRMLAEQTGIQRHTLFRHKAIDAKSSSTIDAESLRLYAAFFGVKEQELYNVPMRKVTPIAKLIGKAPVEALISDLNLTRR
jgi:hypothetical protein